MALTIGTEIPESRVLLGIGQQSACFPLYPGASDYATGGYALSASSFGLKYITSVELIGTNAAGALYPGIGFVFPATSFTSSGTEPATSIQLLVGQPVGGGTGSLLTLGTSATATLSALTTNVATVTVANTFTAGQLVVLQGAANAGFADLNGRIVALASATTALVTFNVTHANVVSGSDAALTVTPLVSMTGNVTVSATAVATSTNSVLTSNVATITAPNTFLAGQFVVLQGFSNALATAWNGFMVQVISASATQFAFNFYHANVTTGADTGTAALVITPGGIPVATGVPSEITNSVLTSNVMTMTAVQQYFAGSTVILQGMTNGAALNGQVASVISTGLSATAFEANLKATNIITGADTGVALPLIGGGPASVAEVPTGTNLSGIYWLVRVTGY